LPTASRWEATSQSAVIAVKQVYREGELIAEERPGEGCVKPPATR
jgi:hypothetical protein